MFCAFVIVFSIYWPFSSIINFTAFNHESSFRLIAAAYGFTVSYNCTVWTSPYHLLYLRLYVREQTIFCNSTILLTCLRETHFGFILLFSFFICFSQSFWIFLGVVEHLFKSTVFVFLFVAHCRIIIGSDFFISAVEFSCGAHCAIFELQTNHYYFYIESMPQSCLSTKSLIFHRFEFLKRVKIIFVFFFYFLGGSVKVDLLLLSLNCIKFVFLFLIVFKKFGKFLGIFEKWLLETKIVVFFSFEITYMKQKLIFPSDVLIVFKFLIVSLFLGFLVIPNSSPCVALSKNSICCSFGVLHYVQFVPFLLNSCFVHLWFFFNLLTFFFDYKVYCL